MAFSKAKMDEHKAEKKAKEEQSFLENVMGVAATTTPEPTEEQSEAVKTVSEPPKTETKPKKTTKAPDKAKKPTAKQTKAKAEPQTEYKGVLKKETQLVLVEKKSQRKNMLFYPSLCERLDQLAKEQNKSFNDLVNQILIEYVDSL